MLKYIALPVAMLCFVATLSAQDLPTEQVNIIKDFDARLLETDRIPLNPELPPLDTAVKRQNYNITGRPITVEYLPPQIRPLAMRGEKVTPVYNGYTKLGAGLPSSLLGEVSYNIAKDKKYNFGIGALHHSANNTAKVENQRFAYTTAGIDGTYYLEQGIAVGGKARYTSDNVFFYGYNNLNGQDTSLNLSFAKEDVRQRFTTVDIGANIFNGERTVADFNYSAAFDFYFLQDSYASRENGFDLNINATKWFQERHAFRVNLRTDFTSYRDTASQSLNNFYLQPNFTFSGDAFRVKLGVNIVSNDDDFSFFPDLELSARVLGPVLGAFAGAEGSLYKNTFRNLSDYNPFVSSRIRIRNTRYMNFYGGIRGVVEGIDYRVQAGYKTTENLATFLWNGADVPRFNVLYDTIDIVYINASLVAPLFRGFEINGKFNQNFFNAGKEGKAWHLPSLTISAGAKYTTDNNKGSVRADLFMENGVPYLDAMGEAKNLNALFDLSLGAEYRVVENVGLFIQVNNLANNRRQRWQHYPVFGINALAGITARF